MLINTAPTQVDTASSSIAYTPAPVNVLIVDDVEDNLTSTRSLLARPGLDVLLASSASSALELLGQHDVALALLDVQMPEVNGFELAEHMRRNSHTRTVPIIFMTGDGGFLTRTFLGYEAGAVDFLVKPIDPRILEGKVRIFVELYQQRRELRERNTELERLLRLNEAMADALRKAHGHALQEAQTDALTGVSNRRHILQMGEATLGDRRREAQPLSLAMLDLDHFKLINDKYGHHMGDAVLSAFCSHVSKLIRSTHMLGRLGGEEFLLLMPGTPLAHAAVILERLHRTLESHAGCSYTFSAGIAQAGVEESLTAVIKRADLALYEAKRSGRNSSVQSPTPTPA